MKIKINTKQLAQIATNVRRFKKLYVTTDGQMFTALAAAEEAVKVKNMIIDEPDDFVGVATITEDLVSEEKLRTFARTQDFSALFAGASIPRGNKERKPFERKLEEPSRDVAVEAEVDAILGLSEKPAEKRGRKPRAEEGETPAVEVEQTENTEE